MKQSQLSRRTAAMKAQLRARPGVTEEPVFAPRGTTPVALMYKVMGKTFAILSVRQSEYVIVKCDPGLAEALRAQYAGIGHRSHLDPRHWISVDLAADVAEKEVKRLVALSYELVCAGLTRKQKAELAQLSS